MTLQSSIFAGLSASRTTRSRQPLRQVRPSTKWMLTWGITRRTPAWREAPTLPHSATADHPSFAFFLPPPPPLLTHLSLTKDRDGEGEDGAVRKSIPAIRRSLSTSFHFTADTKPHHPFYPACFYCKVCNT